MFKVQLISELHCCHHSGRGRQGLGLPSNSLNDTSDGQQISIIIATHTTKGLVEHFLNEDMDYTEFSSLLDYLIQFAVLICLGREVYHIFHGENLCLLLFFLIHLCLQRIGFVRYTCGLVCAT